MSYLYFLLENVFVHGYCDRQCLTFGKQHLNSEIGSLTWVDPISSSLRDWQGKKRQPKMCTSFTKAIFPPVLPTIASHSILLTNLSLSDWRTIYLHGVTQNAYTPHKTRSAQNKFILDLSFWAILVVASWKLIELIAWFVCNSIWYKCHQWFP